MDPTTDHPTPPQTDENTQSANTKHTTDQTDNTSKCSETTQLEAVGHFMRNLIHDQNADWGELPWDAPPATTDSETATNIRSDIQINSSIGDSTQEQQPHQHEPTPPAKKQKTNEVSGEKTPADAADITDPPASDSNATLATKQTTTEHPPPKVIPQPDHPPPQPSTPNSPIVRHGAK